jgi:group I intron endonuclease
MMFDEIMAIYLRSGGEVTVRLKRSDLIGRSGVYAILNQINGKIYVGCSIDLARRLTVHLSDLKAGRHGNRYLQSSYRANGPENFIVLILEFVSDGPLKDAEQRWIDHYRAADRTTGYNIVPDSQHKRLSMETRQRLSASRRGRPLTEQHKNNIRLGNLGLSKPRSKKPRPPKADPRDTFAKISKALMGHAVSDQTKAAIRASKVGKPLPSRYVTNEIQRAEIRNLAADGANNCEIGRMFGISRVTVRNILNNRYLYDISPARSGGLLRAGRGSPSNPLRRSPPYSISTSTEGANDEPRQDRTEGNAAPKDAGGQLREEGRQEAFRFGPSETGREDQAGHSSRREERTLKIRNEILAIISSGEFDGPNFRITAGTLDRKVYQEVAKVLDAVGGKWSRSAKALVFDCDAADAIEPLLLTGEVTRAKQEFGQFDTPETLAEEVVERAEIKPGMHVLEPSCGIGNMVLAIERVGGMVRGFEIDDARIAKAKSRCAFGLGVLGVDFLAVEPYAKFDVVVMNPPFPKRLDIEHVRHAARFVTRGGHLVAIMSAGVLFREDAKAVNFRSMVKENFGLIRELPPDSFKSSGTGVNTCLVMFDA